GVGSKARVLVAWGRCRECSRPPHGGDRGFKSRRGYSTCPGGETDITPLCEGGGPGSTPGWGTASPRLSPECAGTHAILRRSRSRFDSWRRYSGHLFLPSPPLRGRGEKNRKSANMLV